MPSGRKPQAVSISVRRERRSDLVEIAEVHRLAFGGGEVPDLVDAIRRSPRFVPDLSLVALEGTRVVGHVMLSYADLVRPSDSVRVLLLSPLGVTPERQRRGIGSALVRAAVDRADVRGEPLVVVEGVPTFYPKFGFEPARPQGIEPPYPLRDEVFMLRRLAAYEPSLRGRLVYPPAFDAVAPHAEKPAREYAVARLSSSPSMSEHAKKSEPATRADAAFDAVVETFRDRPGISTGTGFGSSAGLRVEDRIFAMLMGGELVLKLPKAHVDDLIAGGRGRPFPGQGRVMREWVAVPLTSRDEWQELAETAHAFVAAGGASPRGRR